MHLYKYDLRLHVLSSIFDEQAGVRNKLLNLLRDNSSSDNASSDHKNDNNRSSDNHNNESEVGNGSSNKDGSNQETDNNGSEADIDTNKNRRTEPASFKSIDVSTFTDSELSRLTYDISQENKKRTMTAAGITKSKSWSFEMSNGNKDVYVCIPVRKQHMNDKAFTAYQTKYNAHVNEFCKAVGGGTFALGVERLLTYLAHNHPDPYVNCGREFGLSLTGTMDADSLAAMSVDSNLKQWQLLKVLKHVNVAICRKLLSVTVKEMEKMFSKDMVLPVTGKYLHETVNDKGTTEVEVISYDYQSLVKVFKYIVAQKIMEQMWILKQ